MTFTDIKNKVYFLTKTNSTSFPVADLVILANNAMERVASLIMQSDGRWQYDDTNQTDLPVATTTVTTSQQDYTLATSHLSIDRVEIKDANSNWLTLQPIDRADFQQPLATNFPSTGAPQYYDIQGSTVFLYPSPNYTQAASLKVYFKRGPVAFTTSDTTAQPGFNSLYHDLIPLHVAFEYATANGLPTATAYFNEIARKEQALQRDYGLRNKDDAPQLTMAPINFL